MGILKFGLLGASGRMGREVIKALEHFPQFQLGAAIIEEDSSLNGKECAFGVPYSSDIEVAVKSCDAFIDFSVPESSVQIAELCAKNRKPLLIGTTGHTSEQRDTLKRSGSSAPILLAANTSVGIAVLEELIERASNLLGEDFDIGLMEVHHRHKRDAPSGTAIRLRDALPAEHREKAEIVSLRGGDIPGDHTVYFFGPDERLEFTHRVRDRAVFARGALKLLNKLVNRPAGFYSVREILSR